VVDRAVAVQAAEADVGEAAVRAADVAPAGRAGPGPPAVDVALVDRAAVVDRAVAAVAVDLAVLEAVVGLVGLVVQVAVVAQVAVVGLVDRAVADAAAAAAPR
jgi:hypothetical protein